jgi:glycosyltransferase involved in cell wall biosynthesis
MVGEGPLRAQVQAVLEAAGVAHLAWLPGKRGDVAEIMRGLHAFALPSLSEGISNSILEAMASSLPVVATAVGGNADLVLQGQTGHIVPPADPQAMALRLMALAADPQLARSMGQAGRQRAQTTFSLQAMVGTYQSVYDRQLRRLRPVQLVRQQQP